jgi:hypothetical protein
MVVESPTPSHASLVANDAVVVESPAPSHASLVANDDVVVKDTYPRTAFYKWVAHNHKRIAAEWDNMWS